MYHKMCEAGEEERTGRLSGGREVVQLVVVECADISRLGRLESVDKVDYSVSDAVLKCEIQKEEGAKVGRKHTVGLLSVVRLAHAVVHADEGTAVLALLACSDSDGLQQVGGAVGRVGGRGAHGADDDDGLLAVDRGVH